MPKKETEATVTRKHGRKPKTSELTPVRGEPPETRAFTAYEQALRLDTFIARHPVQGAQTVAMKQFMQMTKNLVKSVIKEREDM